MGPHDLKFNVAIILQELAFIEFFAGQGNVWKAVRCDSYASVGVDINYFTEQNNEGSSNPFDILSNSGLGCHAFAYSMTHHVLLYIIYIKI